MRPLALAALVLAFAPLSWAAPRRHGKRHVRPAQFPSDTFNAMCDFMIVQEGKAFIDPADKEDSPDPDDLEQFRQGVEGKQLEQVNQRIDSVRFLLQQAEYVRDGCAPEDCPPQSKTYADMVHRVTFRLFAKDESVAMRVRMREADKKYLGTDAKPPQAKTRDSGGDEISALRARAALLQEIELSKPKLARDKDKELQEKLAKARAALVAQANVPDGVTDAATEVTRRTSSGAYRYTATRAVSDLGRDVPSTNPAMPEDPPAPAPPKSKWSLGGLDFAMLAQLAHYARQKASDVYERCYAWVKNALVAMHIVKEYPPGVAAASFNDLVRDRPQLFARKLKKLVPPSWPLPVGSIVVWDRGACGYSSDYGHIEILYKITPPISCSDHCQSFATECLIKLAPKGKVSAYVVEAQPGS